MSHQHLNDEQRAAHYAGLAHGFAHQYAGLIAAELGEVSPEVARLLHRIGFEMGHDACQTLAAAISARVAEVRQQAAATDERTSIADPAERSKDSPAAPGATS
jgi:phage-related minor tail protein